MNEKQQIIDLIDRYTKGDCSPDETALVQSWYAHLIDQSPVDVTLKELEQADAHTRSHFPTPATKKIYPIYKYAAAAAIAIITLTTVVYYSNTKHSKTITKNTALIQPGGNNAVLTLANGKKIDLKDTHSSTWATGGAVVTNNASNGVVTFKYSGSKTEQENNVITEQKNLNIATPRGGQYKLVLPDGSSVYLNASTSLQFPARFAANSRTVTLNGEAYFEVTKNTKKPFIVISKGQTLTVLGTHFCISAYPNETIKTTLSAGSVALTRSSSLKKQILQPEQQATLTDTGFDVKSVNSAEAIAWKDGLFIFRKTPIADVLHQLCRWYNVEADFSNLPNTTFTADLLRTATLQEVITGLNFSNRSKGIKIELIDGRRLKISKNK